MSVKHAARSAPDQRERRQARAAAADAMPDPKSNDVERPVFAVTSTRTLALFGAFLTLLATGFLFLVVHVWDGIDKHLDKIDGELANLDVTQGKFEQFLTSQLPGIAQDLRRNTELSIKLEANVSALTQSVAEVQSQVSTASEQILKLRDGEPLKKGGLDEPGDMHAPTTSSSEGRIR